MNPILIKPSGESSSQVVVRARTRDTLPWQIQKTCLTDGFFWRYKERSGTVIEPISNPRPLPCKLCSDRIRNTMRNSRMTILRNANGAEKRLSLFFLCFLLFLSFVGSRVKFVSRRLGIVACHF